MEEYPKCPICLDIFGINNSHIRAPKVLNCGDSICKECLEKILKENHEDYFLCPICKLKIKTEQIIDNYITNKEIIRLVNASFNIPEEEVNNKTDGTIIKYNILLLGNTFVGKTSLFRRLSQEKYDDIYFVTIGLDITRYYIKYKNKQYELILHDTGGQEKFQSLTKNLMHNKAGVLFIYDISDKKSFDDLEYWYNSYKEQNGKVVGLLIGNKCDLDRKVDEQDARDFADVHGLKYIETSAKLDKNIKKAIALILEEIIKSKPYVKDIIEIDNITVSTGYMNEINYRYGKKCYW